MRQESVKGQGGCRFDSSVRIPTYYVQADLTQVEDCRNIIHKADEEFGRIDCLVNCAAITDRGTVLDTSPELFDQMFAVNTRAPFFLM